MKRLTTTFLPRCLPRLLALFLLFSPSGQAFGDGGPLTVETADSADKLLRWQPSFSLGEMVHFPFDRRDIRGTAVFDFDRDGDLDLYVSYGQGAANNLFSNQLVETGETTFVDVAIAAGVAAEDQDSSGVCFGDIDNDGDHDLLVLSRSGDNRLFENDSRGDHRSFFDISVASGVASNSANSISCAMGDVDRNGLVDVVIGKGSQRATALTSQKSIRLNELNQVLFNQGGSVFIDGTASTGLTHPAEPTKVMPHAVTGTALISTALINQAVSLVDIDQDGDVDLIRAIDRVRSRRGMEDGSAAGSFQVFENDGTGVFVETNIDIDRQTAIAAGSKELAFADFDDNGLIDLQVIHFADPAETRRRQELARGVPVSQWFLQDTTRHFTDPSTTGFGSVASDGADAESRDALVQVEVRGSVGFISDARVNRDGIGAVVRCTPQGRPTALLPVVSSSSHSAQNSLVQSCNLGEAPQAMIEILWPGGVRNRIYDVTAGQRLLVPEMPCSFDDPELSRSQYLSCVTSALDDLGRAGVVGPERKSRLLADADRAYSEASLASSPLFDALKTGGTQPVCLTEEECEMYDQQRCSTEIETPPGCEPCLDCGECNNCPGCTDCEVQCKVIDYGSSITTGSGGPLNLKAELNYDPDVLSAPIAVVMHGFTPDVNNFRNVRNQAQRLRDAGFFAISVAMRWRDGSEGERDSGGLEIYDIYDAVEHVKAEFSGNVDATNVHITGYSGGGGNVMSALTKFPDYFRLGSSFFGMSDYGFDPDTRWYDHGAGGNHRTILSDDVGEPDGSDSIKDKYAARASNRASKNNPYSEIHFFVNCDECTSPQIHHNSYLDLANESANPPGEFDNINIHVGRVDLTLCEDFDGDEIECEVGEVQCWSHGFPRFEEQLAAENWYLDDLLTGVIPEPELNARDELYVAGYVKTKPFSIWLGDGQDAARDLSYNLRDNIKQFSLEIPDDLLFANTLATEGVVEIDTSTMSGRILRTKVNNELAGEFVGGSQAVYTMQDGEKLQIHARGAPIGHWRLNEIDGTTALDASGYGNDGDLNGPSPPVFDFSTKSVPGKVGGALEFDGDDDIIELYVIDSANPLMLADSDFSITVWINQPDGDGDGAQRIVEKSAPGANAHLGYSLWVDKYFIGVSVDGKTRLKVVNPASLNGGLYGEWTHLAATMTADEGHIYINGVDQSLLPLPDPLLLPPDAQTEMRIGSWEKPEGGREFEGSMDDLKIFNYALTEDEVGELQVIPPIANWKLDDEQGNTAVDTSEYEHNGSLTGTTFDLSSELGKVGRALRFDGADDIIDLGSIDSANPLMLADSDFSIAVWINQPDDSGDLAQRIVDKSLNSGNATGGYTLWLDWRFIAVSVEGKTRLKAANPAIQNPDLYGQWNHIAVTMEADEGHIYFNGVDLPLIQLPDPLLLPGDVVANMKIGSWNKLTGGREFKGLMDDLKIFNYALSEAEVKELLLTPPVGHWGFDETTGVVAGDLSEFHNDGNLEELVPEDPPGSAFSFSTSGAPGEVGRALNFDGSNDIVELGSIDSINPLMLAESEFSIAVWINQADGSGDLAQRIVEKSDTSGNAGGGYALWLDHRYIGVSVDGDLSLRVANPAIADPGLYGTWVHLAVTMTADEAHIYLNGDELMLMPSDVHDPYLPPDSVEDMRIGSWTKDGGAGREFKGLMDDLRIYNRVLSLDEIRALAKVP